MLLVAGVLIMKILHFTTGALSIAGEHILLLLALSMVLGSAEKKEQDSSVSEEAMMSMAVYPLAIPRSRRIGQPVAARRAPLIASILCIQLSKVRLPSMAQAILVVGSYQATQPLVPPCPKDVAATLAGI